MSAARDLQTAVWSAMAATRGMLDVTDAGSTIIGLLALRRALGGHLSRAAAPQDVGRILEQDVDRVRAANPDLGEALAELLAPVQRERAGAAGLLRAVDEIDLEAPQADLLAALTRLLAEQGKRGPVFATGSNLLRLITRVAVARAGARVCDPFCGAGLLLAPAALDADRGPAALEGWERNRSSVAIARGILAALGVDGRVAVANALLSPPSSDTYDAVLSAPPFNAPPPAQLHLGDSSRFLFGAPTRHADWLYAQHALSELAPGGTAVLVMSRGPLFRAGVERDVRRALVEADVLDAIVALPPNLLAGTAIPCCLVVLRRDRPAERRGGVLFIEVPAKHPAAADLSSEVVDEVLRVYATLDAASEPLRSKRVASGEIAGADFSLDPTRYLPPRLHVDEASVESLVADLREARARRAHAAERVARVLEHLFAAEQR